MGFDADLEDTDIEDTDIKDTDRTARRDLSHFDSAFVPSELQVDNDGANLTHGDATFAEIPPIHRT